MINFEAVLEVHSNLGTLQDNQAFDKDGKKIDLDLGKIKTVEDRLQAEYDAQEYARNRASEYPSLLELTVALYDTDDKSAVEAKRAAVKAKFPKPS
jgi:hypothetical protein